MNTVPLVSTNVIALVSTNTIGDSTGTTAIGSFTLMVCNRGTITLELQECG